MSIPAILALAASIPVMVALRRHARFNCGGGNHMKSLNLFHHLCCTLLRIVAVGCAAAVITVLPTMLTSRAETVASSPAVDRREAGDSGAQANLADVADGVLFDGWGNAAVRSLSMYYSPDASRGDVQMLGYRASFLPVFDWANGVIDTEAGSDLYSFYATGNGAGRVQSASDPAYAFSYVTRYQEPAGRINGTNGAGYALSMGAAQSRTVTSDYQNWSDAGLSAASGINTATLQSEFNTTTSYGGFGASLTTFGQRISDPAGVTSLSRQAWQDANAAPAWVQWRSQCFSGCRWQRDRDKALRAWPVYGLCCAAAPACCC